jgi:hypothetical protein
MRRRLTIALLFAALAAALFAGVQQGAAKPLRAPLGFFGVDPQATITEADAAYMKAGGIESVRWPMIWSEIQPTAKGPYDWSNFDETVLVAARNGLHVLPFVWGTPGWVSRKPTTMPINSARARQAWTAFLRAAIKRYGPGGEFWAEHAPAAVEYEPPISKPLPIRAWQVWNEANFFYFAYPVSPQSYARLLKLSTPAIKGADPGAKVILTGLFGKPNARGLRGIPASKFLEALYRVPGTKRLFDGIALHPYALDAKTLEAIVEELHEVTTKFHDRIPMYITEMGWGSQNDFNVVAFEQGIQGQMKQLRASYSYLLENRARLDLKQVYWFSWKDQHQSCNFCDSVGLFRQGKGFVAKPAWRAFVSLTGGRARP